MLWYVHTMPPKSDVRFRRRVVLEMLPEENELLQRLAAKHGTLRGTILSALRLLETDESEQLRARVGNLEAQLKRVGAQAAAAKTRRTQDDETAAKAQAEVDRMTTALRGEEARHRGTTSALKKAQAQAEEFRQEAQRLAHLQIRHLYCPACSSFVSEDDWAEQPLQGGGVGVYHKTHEYRGKASMLMTATVMAWREKPRRRAGKGS